MGRLYYAGSTTPVEIPERLLAHLRVVVATKLRRSESFTLSWRHLDGEPGGRTTIWVHPAIELRFVFSSVETERLDPALLQRFANEAGSSAGLTIDLEDVAVDGVEPVRLLKTA
jgi:integrase